MTKRMTIDGSGTPRATCVLAPNVSPVTLNGTNTWIIAEPGSPSAIVVDPGPQDEGHLRRVLEMACTGGRRIAQIILTHGHRDHSAGAGRLAVMSGAPVLAANPARRVGDAGIFDRDLITAAGCDLHVIGTPGHSWDSVSLLLPADRALLTGDTVLGRGVTAIARNGALADYLRTLGRLRKLADQAGLQTLLPGHGPLRDDPARTVDHHISYCQQRLDQIQAALADGACTPAEIVAKVFVHVNPAAQRIAESSVRAHLDYLKSTD
jgi:glyoxylase-like metal-dependent hydrolase (beta-lactamase superfamily II)